jgi:hypothetical protein
MTREYAHLRKWWQRAGNVERFDGLTWYVRAQRDCEALAREYNVGVGRVIDALSVLSSNLTWAENMRALKRLLESYRKKRYANCGTFEHCSRQAWEVLHGRGQVTGPKRIAFAKAIAGDTKAVVVDRWMLRAAGISKIVASPSDRQRIEKAFKRLSKETGVEARELQAVVWVTVRNGAQAPLI